MFIAMSDTPLFASASGKPWTKSFLPKKVTTFYLVQEPWKGSSFGSIPRTRSLLKSKHILLPKSWPGKMPPDKDQTSRDGNGYPRQGGSSACGRQDDDSPGYRQTKGCLALQT